MKLSSAKIDRQREGDIRQKGTSMCEKRKDRYTVTELKEIKLSFDSVTEQVQR